MKDAKMLLIIKNCSIELAQRIQKVINEYNAEREKGSPYLLPVKREKHEKRE